MDDSGTLGLMLRRFWPLVLLGLLLGVGFGVVTGGGADSYQATARVQVSSTMPTSSQQALSVTSQARAIATSPAIVGAAMRAAHIQGDPPTEASKDVNVAALGTSAVVDISVTAGSPTDARTLTDALAKQLVSFVNDAGTGGVPQVLKSMQDQMASYARQLSQLEGQLQEKSTDLQIQGQVISVRGLLTSLAGDYNRLLVETTVRSTASVVSAAAPGTALPTHRAQKTAFAALIGLVIGLLAAAVAALLRPAVPGVTALREAVRAPLLGHVDRSGSVSSGLALRLRLAADRADVDSLVLAGAGSGDLAERVADHLGAGSRRASVTETALAGARTNPSGGVSPAVDLGAGQHLPVTAPLSPNGNGASASTAATGGEVPDGLTVLTLAQAEAGDPLGRLGLVFVAKASLRHDDVLAARDLVEGTGWPVLGIVAATGRSRLPFGRSA
jgi:uncharacterized protein involved in exopolysaccharide biosynthesis